MFLKWMPIGMIVSIVAMAIACGSAKKIAYMQDVPDSIYQSAYSKVFTEYKDPLIQPNDILQVSILTLDPNVNSILTTANTANFSTQPGSSSSAIVPHSIAGFLVDKRGCIELPLIGSVKVSELSTGDAKDAIKNRVSMMYRNPVVSVRFANFSISVLGEVARPASYTVPNEKISVLDAIGMAGDLTIYGKRENVLLMRDSAGHKNFIRFNLNASDLVQSPYFYLRQGDILYVEPNKSKVVSTDAARTKNITIAASLISLLVVVFSRI